jgi:hypothetical protein
MEARENWCSGLEQLPNGSARCRFGHTGPGMQACKGIRYPDGKALAPCEREDLPFDESRKCVRPNAGVKRRRSRPP